MCELCDKVYDDLSEYKCTYKSYWDEDNALIKDSNNKVNLYIPCDDYYYSRMVMKINYCPECGRKL